MSDTREFCTDCDYCGHIKIVRNDEWGGKGCHSCLKAIEEDN